MASFFRQTLSLLFRRNHFSAPSSKFRAACGVPVSRPAVRREQLQPLSAKFQNRQNYTLIFLSDCVIIER